MLGGDRLERVSGLLRTELSSIMHREIEFDPGTLCTVTRVTVSPDLEHAKVWISVLPANQARLVLAALEREIGRIQRLLNRRLVMEYVPKIRFLIDESEENAATIDHLLDTLHDSP